MREELTEDVDLFREVGKNLRDSLWVSETRTPSPREGQCPAQEWVVSCGAGLRRAHEGLPPSKGEVSGLQVLRGRCPRWKGVTGSRQGTGPELGCLAGVLCARVGC